MTDTPVTNPHHQVEDIPPDDPDTKIMLFEQALDVVKGSDEAAAWLRKNAEIVLGEVFSTADRVGDTTLANRVNDIWDAIQAVTDFDARHSAIHAGSKEAMTALKAQRDKLIADWKSLRDALADYDTEHPELIDYAETLREMWSEYDWMFDDESYDIAFDNIREDVVFTFRNRIGMTSYQAGKAFDLIIGSPGNLTDEQIGILKLFAATLPKGKEPVSAAELKEMGLLQETEDDDEDDES